MFCIKQEAGKRCRSELSCPSLKESMFGQRVDDLFSPLDEGGKRSPDWNLIGSCL